MNRNQLAMILLAKDKLKHVLEYPVSPYVVAHLITVRSLITEVLNDEEI